MRITALIAATTTLIVGCSTESEGPAAPSAEKRPIVHELHGSERNDDYFWLRERENPDVIAYLDAENDYTDEQMAPFQGLQGILVEEMTARIKQDDTTVPMRRGDYFYYTRYTEGAEYPVYARRKASLDAPEEVLLDVNLLAGDADYYAVSNFSVSPDDKIAAYGVDTTGRRFYDLYFLNLETGELLPDTIEKMTGNFEWANDSETIIYGKQHPETLRSYQAFRYKLGELEHTLIYQEDDETNYLFVNKVQAGDYIYIGSSQTLYTEVRYISANSPTDEPSLFLAREKDHLYSVQDGGDRFFVTTNYEATNFRLVEVPLDATARENWKDVVAHRDNVLIEDVTVFKNHLVVEVSENGLRQIEIVDRMTGQVSRLPFDEEAYTAYGYGNAEYDTNIFRYAYESMTTPDSTYDFDLVEATHTLMKEAEVVGDFDRSNYETRRIFVAARDGTKVPVSLVYRKGMEKNGKNPLLQYAYGSYGSSSSPYFSANRLSLLDRGFIYAIAHIRGGSEMGRDWYYDGRQLSKKNTFTDFIDVSKFLIEDGYTSADHLYASGASAGGLLMGAVLNMAPELYNGVVAGVPFVDVITTMLDADIPLTAGEWDEWGDPRKKEYYDYMLSYSPYDNVRAVDYPNVLVTTGLHDSQVQYWEPAKWVAKLRDYNTSDNMLVLKTDMSAGHSGKTGRFRRIDDTALDYSFFLGLEGIRE